MGERNYDSGHLLAEDARQVLLAWRTGQNIPVDGSQLSDRDLEELYQRGVIHWSTGRVLMAIRNLRANFGRDVRRLKAFF